jgi:hypothetical protein
MAQQLVALLASIAIHVLKTQPRAQDSATLRHDYYGRGPARLAAGAGALHVDCVDGAGATKLTGPYIACRFGCRCTARNIRSIRRIADAMKQGGA